MQIHYESRDHPGTEVEEESTFSTPVAFDLPVPRRFWKPQGQDVVPLGFNV